MFNVSTQTQTSKYYVSLLLGDQSVPYTTFLDKHSSYFERNQKYHNSFHHVWVTPYLFKILCGQQIKENGKALLIKIYWKLIAPKQQAYLLCQSNIYRLIQNIPTDNQRARKFFPRTKKLSYQKCMYMALKYWNILNYYENPTYTCSGLAKTIPWHNTTATYWNSKRYRFFSIKETCNSHTAWRTKTQKSR